MLKHPFLEAIQNQILVWDSAAGTQLRERIPPYVQCLNACNIHQDYFHIVQKFHQEYRNEGADILQTNTFGANATKLKNYGFEMQVAEINRAGAVLAREIAGDERYVAGSVGPLEMDALGEHFDGSWIEEACNFYFGGGFTIAENLRTHVKHLTNKVKSGAKLAYTQPAFTLADIERTYEVTKGLGIKILYGVLPITSFRSASFARDNLGMYIPQSIVDQFRDVGDTAGKRLGMKLTLDLVQEIRTQNRFPVDRFYIVPPAAMNWKNRQRVVSEIICGYQRNDDGNRTFH